jgi:chromosome segregation ATPase
VKRLQDTYKTETTSALHTLKSEYDTATSNCNQLTQQLTKQQADHSTELASLQETHAAAAQEQQLEAESLRQQLDAAQARAATAEEQLVASKAAAEEDAATITKLQANITGGCSAGMAWQCCEQC